MYQYTQKPMHVFVPLLMVLISLPLLVSHLYYSLIYRIIYIAFSISFAWLLIKLIYVFADTVLAHHDVSTQNNLSQRKLVTQMQFIKRMLIILVVVISVSAILLNFESVRRFGTGILTSAGIVGIIIGFAAQRSLGNLLAGLQIAFSQPIRIDDVVIVENEWGRIEEITLTYVVIKLWDMRRLVVPLNYFIEKPFQNWTKKSSDIIGSVSWFLDYNVPIDAMRKKLNDLLTDSPLWDGNTRVLQVVNATDKSIEIRAIMSARNAGDAWDLRCTVREEMIKFIREKYSQSLPTLRTDVNMLNPPGNNGHNKSNPSKEAGRV
ncbi:MAG: mechanosensitive ion channel [Bacteroidales bacterium]|nr:mechanosensitive ion channel [Bacteroidales bacterium]